MHRHTPGSPEAVMLGCICPQVDNEFGKGINGGTVVSPITGQVCFYVDTECKLHGPKAVEARSLGPWVQ